MGTRITTKGQVTVPKDVRDRMGVKPGDEIEFVEEGGEFKLRKAVRRAGIRKYRGYLKRLAGTASDELVVEMRDG